MSAAFVFFVTSSKDRSCGIDVLLMYESKHSMPPSSNTPCFQASNHIDQSSYPSLHDLNTAISSNEIQTLPLFDLFIALSTLRHPQDAAHVPCSACTQFTDAQHAPRAVCLLHRKSSRFAFDRCRCYVGVWLCRREERSVGWCGEEGCVD